MDVIKTDNFDKDLVGKAHWARQRLIPKVIIEEETPKSAPS